MEYLLGFIIFFGGWMLLRFLLNASYASGFAEGAWQVTHGGIESLGELARPIDAEDLEKEIDAKSSDINRSLTSRNIELAKDGARELGKDLVARTWKLRGMLR